MILGLWLTLVGCSAASDTAALIPAPSLPSTTDSESGGFMPVKVPFTNAQTCHDALKKSTVLWSAFNDDLLGVANASKPAAQRLDDVVARSKSLWAAAVATSGVSPREYDGPWRCAVGDLNAALVDAALKEIDASPASNDAKRAEVGKLRIAAEAAIASPFLMGVQLALTQAERKYEPVK